LQNVLPDGIYSLLPTFFNGQDELDLATLQRHIRCLMDSGIAAALELTSGYGGNPRMPLQPLSSQECSKLARIFEAAHLEA
jgi:dihydrodipicolinate synthase/N-acetylneuraminate lyase